MVTTIRTNARLPETTGMFSKITRVDVTNQAIRETVHHVAVDTVVDNNISEQKEEEDEK